jgi:hypothetical protein
MVCICSNASPILRAIRPLGNFGVRLLSFRLKLPRKADHFLKAVSVNTLEDNRPQYRLGDAILMRQTPYGRRAFDFVASNRPLFEGTVLFEYAARIDRSNNGPQWEVLKEVVSEKTREIGLDPPRENELVIHLRLGDRKGFKLRPEKLVNYVMNLINRFDSPISQVTIVTAIHFGKLVLKNQMSAVQVSVATLGENAKLQNIFDLFSERGRAARLYSHNEIDRDFCFLSNSRLLVLGNGHFSLCAAMVSQAECFVPPWTGSGSIFNIGELLESRAICQAQH